MGLTPISAIQFARMMIRLWPAGRWVEGEDTERFRLMHAQGEELARVHQRQIDLLEENDPRTTSELLPEWEAQYGLTDSSGTEAERRARLQTRVLSMFGFSARPVDYQRVLAPALDLDENDVEIIEFSAAQAASVERPRDVYRFYIYRNPALPGTPDLAFAQAEVDRIKHSHTRGVVIESKSFKCDDPYSLCDRDPLGV